MPIYLDHNASMPLCPKAREAIICVMNETGNASSIHQYGRTIRHHIETARKIVADAVHVSPAQVIFTSGATESNNMALRGFEGQTIISSVEHDSIIHARPDSLICPVDQRGILDLEALEDFLKQQTGPTLVSLQYANNETGILQPMDRIVSLVRHYKAKIHCDAVQVLGKLELDWKSLNLDAISLSAHKIGGPHGVGALIVSPDLALKPLIKGGGQERSFRPGTENVLGIVGFAAALQSCKSRNWEKIAHLRAILEGKIKSYCPESIIFGETVDRLPNTVNLTMPGVKSDLQVMNFDLLGIAISAGSACSSGKVKASRILQAMKVPPQHQETAIRVSLGIDTTESDVDSFVDGWKRLFDQSRTRIMEKG